MNAVVRHGVSIALACRTFQISETCYRYSPILSDENEEIADWLERLTANKRSWGFGLCFLYLRNVQGYGWNHKRVYRIYCELELNLRIKPKKRLKRDKPEPLAVPERPNETWSMDFMLWALGCANEWESLPLTSTAKSTVYAYTRLSFSSCSLFAWFWASGTAQFWSQPHARFIGCDENHRERCARYGCIAAIQCHQYPSNHRRRNKGQG